MKKSHLIFLQLWTLVSFGMVSYGQNIQQTGPVILPISPSTSYIVSPGQTRSIVSGTSITLGNGTHFQAGSNVSVKIGNSPIIAPAPSNPSQNLNMNWVMSKTYDLDGNIVAEQKSFFDNTGKALQTQVKNIAAGHVLATQPMYDANGRVAISTLPAPTNNAEFNFKQDFVNNSGGTKYNYANFDLAKTNNPDPVANSAIGTLGWYYSDNNSLEPYVATTAFPYARTSFLNDGTGNVKRSAGIGDELRMGKGRETSGNQVPVLNELDYYKAVRARFFSEAVVGGNGDLNIRGLQNVSTDQNGYQSVQITDLSGKPLMSGRPDANGPLSITNHTVINAVAPKYLFSVTMAGLIMGGGGGIGGGPISFGINSKYNVTVYKNGSLEYSGIGDNFVYGSLTLNGATYTIESANPFSVTHSSGCNDCPAKVAESEISSIHYFNLLQPSTVTITGNYELYDMKTEGLVNAGSLPAGYYKVKAIEGNVDITYTNKLADVSYLFYNQLGQNVASIAPEGVNALLSNGLTSFATLNDVPFATKNEYDVRGRLSAAITTDAGRTEFIYRKDGMLRFSQNAEQRKTGRFSYINYDRWSRSFEYGEYLPGDITFAAAKIDATLQEDVSTTGGLTGGNRQFKTITHYDLPDQSHGLPGYVQDEAFLKSSVSWTENANGKTWYNYDDQGRVTWVVKSIAGLGTKTINFTYNKASQTEIVDFQKDVPSERFVHHYTYDASLNLDEAFISKDGINKSLQAKYYYYLHGPLKRVELADNLQGIDYTYTAEGMLKAINHPYTNIDPGKDGIQNSFAHDAFAMTLEYFSGDYARNGSGISSINPNTTKTWYNGNITAQSWKSLKPNTVVGTYGASVNNPAMFTYEYDDRQQFNSNKFGTPNFGSNSFSETVNVNREHGITYDANGNIKTLNRNNTAGTQLSLNYSYEPNTNKLQSVANYASYGYDDLGQMVSQQRANGQGYYLKYEPSGKVSEIYADAAFTQLRVSFGYDETGMRIRKTDHVQNVTSYYVYDATGNILAIYDNNGTALQQKELPIYAADRVGTYNRLNDSYVYELSDNLGNVRVVINKNKTSAGHADVIYYSDYYPFGSPLTLANNDYRFGYQGQFAEADKETGWNNFDLRMYDPVIGRWMSVDPYGEHWSPYMAMNDNPITVVDPDGGCDGCPDPPKPTAVKSSVQDNTRVPVQLKTVVIYGRSSNTSYIRPKVFDFWERWSMNENFFAKVGYSILDDPYIMYTHFFNKYGARHLDGSSVTYDDRMLAGIGTLLTVIPVGKSGNVARGVTDGLNKTISIQKQARHVAGTAKKGGGFLNNIGDAQSVLNAVHSGEATFLGTSKAGHQVYKFNGVTGTNVNLGAGITGQPTNVFMIKGTTSPSVVPTSPLWKP